MYILVYVKWNVCITAIASCNIYIQYIIVSTSPSIWWGQHWVQPLPPTFIFLPFFFLFLYFVLYVFIIYLIFLQPRKIRSSLQCGLFDYNIFNSVSGFPVFFCSIHHITDTYIGLSFPRMDHIICGRCTWIWAGVMLCPMCENMRANFYVIYACSSTISLPPTIRYSCIFCVQ